MFCGLCLLLNYRGTMRFASKENIRIFVMNVTVYSTATFLLCNCAACSQNKTKLHKGAMSAVLLKTVGDAPFICKYIYTYAALVVWQNGTRSTGEYNIQISLHAIYGPIKHNRTAAIWRYSALYDDHARQMEHLNCMIFEIKKTQIQLAPN